MSSDDGSKGELVAAAVRLADKAYDGIIKPNEPEASEAMNLMLRAVLLPLRSVVWTAERAFDYLNAKVAQHLEARHVTELRTPDPQLYLTAVEGVRFAASDDMRVLYANLLVTAMDPETAHLAHPSFAEVLRQLNADEARLLPYLRKKEQMPTMYRSGKGLEVVCGEPDGLLARPDLKSLYLVNLTRLGLLEVLQGWDEDLKDSVEAIQAAIELPWRRFESPPTVAMLTPYGEAFCDACLPPVAEVADR